MSLNPDNSHPDRVLLAQAEAEVRRVFLRNTPDTLSLFLAWMVFTDLVNARATPHVEVARARQDLIRCMEATR